MLPTEYASVPVEGRQPTVSAHRRLQNRVAQRKFRERKAQKEKAKAAEENGLDVPITPHTERDITPHIPPDQPFDQQLDQHFQYMLEEYPPTSYDEPLNFLASSGPGTSIDGIESHPQARPNDLHWLSPTTVELGNPVTPPYANAFPNAIPQTSHMVIPPSGASVGAHQTVPWPSRKSSRQEYFAYHTPPRSDANSPPMPVPLQTAVAPPTAPVSPASSTPPKTHSISRRQSSCTALSSNFFYEDDDAKPPSPLLHVATRSRKRAVIQVLLRRGAASINERDSEGRTALHIAAELGDEALVGLLLSQNADPQVKDCRGRLPLHYAVENGQCEVVEMLLDREKCMNDL